MSSPVDPRVSDEETGLPPLEELGTDETLVVLAWAIGDGLVAAGDGDPVACRYLHVRGLVTESDGSTTWAQGHFAIPVEHAMDISVAIAGGAG